MKPTSRHNVFHILAFALFWTYGFFGALTGGGVPEQIVLTLFLSIVLTILVHQGFLFDKLLVQAGLIHPRFEERVRVRVLDFRTTQFWGVTFAAFFVVLVFLSWPDLGRVLSDDQIYHAQKAHLQGITLIAKLRPKLGESFEEYRFKTVLWVMAFGMLAFFWGFRNFYRRAELPLRALSTLGFFLAFRGFAWFAGGNTDPHPPLRLLPGFVLSGFFGVGSLPFRITSVLFLCAGLTFLYRQFRWFLSRSQAFSACLCIGTIPIVWHAAVLYEFSIVAFVLISVFAFLTSRGEDFWTTENLFLWTSIASIGVLFRQSAILVFIPLVLTFRKRLNREQWIALLPVAVVAPFFLKSLLFGTPSTQSMTSENLNAIERVTLAVQSGAIFSFIVRDLGKPWAFLLVAAFLPWGGWRNSRFFSLSVFFSAGLFLFFSTDPGVWGTRRYQAEYAAPFAALGFFRVLLWLSQHRLWPLYIRPAATSTFLILFTFNILTFKSMTASLRSEFTQPWKEALTAVHSAGFSGRYYKAGTVYGTFLEVLIGQSIHDVFLSQQTLRKVCGIEKAWVTACPAEERVEPAVAAGVELVIFDSKAPGSSLLSKGWTLWGTFKDSRTEAALHVLRKP